MSRVPPPPPVEAIGSAAAAQPSTAAAAVWGKSGSPDSPPLPLVRHMADSAAVARRYAAHFTWPFVESELSEHERARLMVIAAALHDVGKASPVFQYQPVQGQESGGYGERLARVELPPLRHAEGRKAEHATLGGIIVKNYLVAQGWAKTTAGRLASVIAGHHGRFPSILEVGDVREQLYDEAAPAWRDVQRELCHFAFAMTGVDARDLEGIVARASTAELVLLTGLVIISDWTASDTEHFPIARHTDEVTDPRSAEERADDAWAALGYPDPWQPSNAAADDRMLRERFGLSDGATLRPTQRAALEAARDAQARFVILEAPMGAGKTETALLLAEEMASRTGARGIAMLLPTMATSDAMFSRVLDWLGHALDGGAEASVFLAHSRRAHNTVYERVLRDGRSYSIDDAPLRGRAISVPALARRKTGVLADFVIGTIDQLLMTSLASRHVALRHLAFAHKVVVVDEVHAADAYMSAFLERALEWLGHYGTPTILLSATLPPAQRAALTSAYARGVASRSGAGEPEPAALPTEDLSPRLTVLGDAAPGVTLTSAPPSDGHSTAVHVEHLADSDDALVETLAAGLVEGGCAAVVRNTVRRCIETARMLATDPRIDAEIVVAHARFTAADRARGDARLLSLFGKGVPDADGRFTRPWHDGRARIVVGTSVIEQSLDIDFDLLVSDLAPVDLLLQRIGRLHRHPRHRPVPLRTPRCLVTAYSADCSDTPRLDAGGMKIYGAHQLLMALVVLRPHLAGSPIALPDDVPRLVREAHSDTTPVPAAWADAVSVAAADQDSEGAERRGAAGLARLQPPGTDRLPLYGFASLDSLPEHEESMIARVRDGEDTIEVVLVRRADDGTVTSMPDGDSEPVVLPEDAPPSAYAARRAVGGLIRLPPWHSTDRTIAWLERSFRFAAWDQSPLLAGQLRLVLDTNGDGLLGEQHVHYDTVFGLVIEPAITKGPSA